MAEGIAGYTVGLFLPSKPDQLHLLGRLAECGQPIHQRCQLAQDSPANAGATPTHPVNNHRIQPIQPSLGEGWIRTLFMRKDEKKYTGNRTGISPIAQPSSCKMAFSASNPTAPVAFEPSALNSSLIVFIRLRINQGYL